MCSSMSSHRQPQQHNSEVDNISTLSNRNIYICKSLVFNKMTSFFPLVMMSHSVLSNSDILDAPDMLTNCLADNSAQGKSQQVIKISTVQQYCLMQCCLHGQYWLHVLIPVTHTLQLDDIQQYTYMYETR